jgi:hypothetical protein
VIWSSGSVYVTSVSFMAALSPFVTQVRRLNQPPVGPGAPVPQAGIAWGGGMGAAVAPFFPDVTLRRVAGVSTFAVLAHVPAPPAGWLPDPSTNMLLCVRAFLAQLFPGQVACTHGLHSFALGAHVAAPATGFLHPPPPTTWVGGVCPGAPVVPGPPVLVVVGHLQLTAEVCMNGPKHQGTQASDWATPAPAAPAAGTHRKPRKGLFDMGLVWGPGASLRFLAYTSLRGLHDGSARPTCEHPDHGAMVRWAWEASGADVMPRVLANLDTVRKRSAAEFAVQRLEWRAASGTVAAPSRKSRKTCLLDEAMAACYVRLPCATGYSLFCHVLSFVPHT